MEGGPESVRGNDGGKAQGDATLLALKVEEGATSQGLRAAASNWKRPGDGSSPRASERTSP